MITFFAHLDKPLSQNIYNSLIDQLNILALECPCCHHRACLTKHAYYPRQLRNYNGIVSLSILRLKCRFCPTTHALVPDVIVPYSQVPFENHVDIAFCQNDDELIQTEDINPFLSIQMIRYIHTQFSLFWKERLLAAHISVSYDMIPDCFLHFSRQFMQIRACPNSLFLPPT